MLRRQQHGGHVAARVPGRRAMTQHPWVVALVIAICLLAFASAACGGQDDGTAAPSTSAAETSAAGSTSESAGAPGFPTSDAPLVRLMIPTIGIDQAPVEGEVDPATNTMIAPHGPSDIAYYTYSAHPGKGNAVFSGHVDYVNVGPAVFWNLRDLKPGDPIVVRLRDGLELRYAVESNDSHSAQGGPWQELFAADAAPDAITLYTCDCEFDTRARNYSERRAVRAVRVG
jgi:sortase (surface protein transpeptidase)